MKTLAIASLGLLLLAPFSQAQTVARSYVSALLIESNEALRFEIASPRMSPTEFEKAISTDEIRTALNQRYMSNLGSLIASRNFLIGNQYMDAGKYRIALNLATKTGLELLLISDAQSTSIPLTTTYAAGGYVPQLTVAFLSGAELDRFDLELRFGSLRGTTPLLFSGDDLISGMNNLAYELLTVNQADAKASRRALRLAIQANKMTRGQIPGILDTLALAHFSNGNVDLAIQTQRKAIQLVGDRGGKQRTQLQVQLLRFEQAATIKN